MPNIISRTGEELNAAYQIDSIQGVDGLILESWGPSPRNASYNEALEIILERLQEMKMQRIGINVISKDLLAFLPNFSDRAILLDDTSEISLQTRHPRDIRLEIGRAQARLKQDPGRAGGNRTKRILLHSPQLVADDWFGIASSIPASSTQKITQSELAIPRGALSPKTFTQLTVVTERDASVRAWVLHNAAGVCDLCRKPAPFLDCNGLPFLEVHHVVALSVGGPDIVSNTVALCPNCHRELHYGAEKKAKLEKLYAHIARLIRVDLSSPESEQANIIRLAALSS